MLQTPQLILDLLDVLLLAALTQLHFEAVNGVVGVAFMNN